MLDKGFRGSGSNGSCGIGPRLVGQCPVVNVVVDGVVVPSLLDTGSMVTTITESFFLSHFQPRVQEQLQCCRGLRLKAANGLDIPYSGYVELDVEVLGKLLPRMGILVVKDSGDVLTQQKKGLVPGVLGMNVLVSCYRELFSQHGDQLFQSSVLRAAAPGWGSALSECQTLEHLPSSGHIGLAVTPRGPAVRIPAGTLRLVPATCRQDLASCVRAVLLETVDQGEELPPGLLVPSVLLPVEKGSLVIPVVNVGHQDQWVKPKVALGQLSMVSVCPARLPVFFTEQEDDQGPVAYIQSVGVQNSPLVDLGDMYWPNLNCEEQQEVKALLEQYVSVFSQETGDLGCTTLVEHEIPLLDDIPVRQRYRRLSPSQYGLVKAHIQELVECGIAKPSCSPYSSPIVVVQKKDGSIRLCVDYRQLNAKTRKDAFPLPRIEESLDALAGARYFSTLDLASGYNQVPVAAKDQAKTAFCTPFGLFEFQRMPFGLCNAPGTFQRLMERIFGDQRFQSLLLYLDDVVVFSSTFSEHMERLRLVLERLKQNGLKLKLGKCHFFQTEVKYLGHVISAAGVSTDPDKIAAVSEWKVPS
uniref:ribonuclease H n=1 Tax=Astyanax mexicanus TaxID=7994 RepID=A0A8B9GTI5_ASTMX